MAGGLQYLRLWNEVLVNGVPTVSWSPNHPPTASPRTISHHYIFPNAQVFCTNLFVLRFILVSKFVCLERECCSCSLLTTAMYYSYGQRQSPFVDGWYMVWMIYDGHMIPGDECGPNFLTFVLQLRKNPGKNLNQKNCFVFCSQLIWHPPGAQCSEQQTLRNNFVQLGARNERWHSWRWISIGDRLRAFNNFITNRTSQSPAGGIRASIFNRCNDAIVRIRDVPLVYASSLL